MKRLTVYGLVCMTCPPPVIFTTGSTSAAELAAAIKTYQESMRRDV